MAYDKIIPIKKRLDNCINYVLNEEKTLPEDGAALETAINCDLEGAYYEMGDTKRRWDKQGGVLGYHIIHSYAPGEVTPQEAHDAGVEFARRLLGDRYEVVVATHTDKDHLHCHIVFNSVSFVDGKKYRNDFKAYFGDIRETSNEVSQERGLSVIEPEGGGKHYAEWDAQRQRKTTLRDLIRQDIDTALAQSYTLHSFWLALERQGYQVKRGESVKHTAIKPPCSPRFVRLASLGEDYIEARLLERLGKARSGPPIERALPVEVPYIHTPAHHYAVKGGVIPKARRHPRSFRGLYFFYLRFLRGMKKRPPPYVVRREVTKLRRFTEQFYFLREYRIDTSDQLSMLSDAMQAEIDNLTERRKALYERKRYGEDVAWELEQINQDLRPLRRSIKLCARIEGDIPHIQENIRLCQEAQERAEKSKIKERRPKLWR